MTMHYSNTLSKAQSLPHAPFGCVLKKACLQQEQTTLHLQTQMHDERGTNAILRQELRQCKRGGNDQSIQASMENATEDMKKKCECKDEEIIVLMKKLEDLETKHKLKHEERLKDEKHELEEQICSLEGKNKK